MHYVPIETMRIGDSYGLDCAGKLVGINTINQYVDATVGMVPTHYATIELECLIPSLNKKVKVLCTVPIEMLIAMPAIDAA